MTTQIQSPTHYNCYNWCTKNDVGYTRVSNQGNIDKKVFDVQICSVQVCSHLPVICRLFDVWVVLFRLLVRAHSLALNTILALGGWRLQSLYLSLLFVSVRLYSDESLCITSSVYDLISLKEPKTFRLVNYYRKTKQQIKQIIHSQYTLTVIQPMHPSCQTSDTVSAVVL